MATTLLSQFVQSTPRNDLAALLVTGAASSIYLSRGILWDKKDPNEYLLYQRPQQQDGATGLRRETRDIARKLEEADKTVVVFFGSQSGTAEGFAHRLARELSVRYGIGTLTADLSDYDAASIANIPSSKIAIFILSTFGEGDPSDNTAGLWDWINNGDLSLPSLRYMAFGLGNSNYKFYNRVVDVVCSAFSKAGGQSLLPIGRADDAQGATEEDFMDWRAAAFDLLQNSLGYEPKEATYQPSIKVVFDDSLAPIDLHDGAPIENRHSPSAFANESPIQPLPITSSRELFASGSRNCLHYDLDLSPFPTLKYRTGDHIAIWPSNPLCEVNLLLTALSLSNESSIPISINRLDACSAPSIPTPTTLLALFTHYLEVSAPVSRDTVLSLAQFAPTPDAKALLTNLGKSKDAYKTYLESNHITLGRLLHLVAPHTHWPIPLEWVLETVSPLKPRYYSISSSSLLEPKTCSITAIVSSTPLPAAPSLEPIPGLATTYLLGLHQRWSGTAPTLPEASGSPTEEPPKLYAQIRKSKFKPPIASARPIIMVAAGTGMAPFRAFIAERAKLHKIGKDVGKMLLFFGCRRPEEDYLYREELVGWTEELDGRLEVITAFSREPGEGKVYVQDRVGERGDEVREKMVREDAGLYICGSAAMAREVGKVVETVVKDGEEWSEEELRSWIEGKRRTGRWLEDVWG